MLRKKAKNNKSKGKKEQQQFTRNAINSNINERKESTTTVQKRRMVCRRSQVQSTQTRFRDSERTATSEINFSPVAKELDTQ